MAWKKEEPKSPRYFNGKPFWAIGDWTSKSSAQSLAERERKGGRLARIVYWEGKNSYRVYVR